MPKTEPTSPLLLTRREVAKLLCVSEGTIVNLEKCGTLTPVRLRGAVRHRRADIEAAIDQLAAAPTTPENKTE